VNSELDSPSNSCCNKRNKTIRPALRRRASLNVRHAHTASLIREAILIQTCLRPLPFLLLVTPSIATTDRLVAQLAQREIPYFVDAAATEYDLEQDAKEFDRIRRLPSAEQFQANIRNNLRRQQRWRVYPRNDGTWAPDPIFGKQDYVVLTKMCYNAGSRRWL